MILKAFIYALRNLKRNRLSTFINITGFSIGIAAFLLIVSYIKYEKGYDSFYRDADNIYRVGVQFVNSNSTIDGSMIQYPVGNILKEEYAEVEEVARVWSNYNLTVEVGDKKFYEEYIYNVDASFPGLFCQMILGNAETSLQGGNSMIISEEVAKKYFGKENPIGKVMKISKYGPHQVTGVFKNRSNMSHFNFEILLPMTQLISDYGTNWESHNFYTYIRLRDDVGIDDFQPKLDAMQARYRTPQLEGTGLDEQLFMEPVTDIRLYSYTLLDFKQNGYGHYIPLFLIIAVVIILFATFNYFNFASFQAVERARAIGVNRILGAEKSAIIRLFLVEAFVFIFISTFIGALLAVVLFPSFANFYEMTYQISLLTSGWFWGYLGIIIVINTLVSGIYPAMVGASFKLNEVIRGKNNETPASIKFRSLLTVIQYSVSCLLMIFSLVSYYQIEHMRTHDLGFEKDNVLVAREPVILDNIDNTETYKLLRNATAQIPGIKEITYCDYVPGGQYERFDRIKLVGGEEIYDTYMNSVSHNFIDFFGIELLAGRNFSLDNTSDFDYSVIINEKLAKTLGFNTPEEAVNQQIQYYGRKYIVGVVSDFHQESLKRETAPMLFFVTDWPGYFAFKVSGNNLNQTINQVGEEWGSVFAGNSFNYFFLDEYFNRNYAKDNKAWQVLRLYSFLAILISVLGLWGAIVHQMKQSTKKIAMYKVLGAPKLTIFWVFIKRTAIMIGIAFLIGLPINIFLLENWLSSFPYRIAISVAHFIIPLSVLVIIALVTIGSQILKVVSSNLVFALKSE